MPYPNVWVLFQGDAILLQEKAGGSNILCCASAPQGKILASFSLCSHIRKSAGLSGLTLQLQIKPADLNQYILEHNITSVLLLVTTGFSSDNLLEFLTWENLLYFREYHTGSGDMETALKVPFSFPCDCQRILESLTVPLNTDAYASPSSMKLHLRTVFF